MKEKFDNENVKNLFQKYDLIVMMETHFNKRHKCPIKFILMGRSPTPNKTHREGVTVYTKNTLNVKYQVFDNISPDAVIFELENTNAIFIASYITPENRYLI